MFDVLASFVGISIGPGEVLLPERQAIPSELNQLGRDLVFALRGEEDKLSDRINRLTVFDPEADGEKLFFEENCCPTCFSTAFQLVSPNELKCAFCHATTVFIKPKKEQIELEFHAMTKEQRLERWKYHRENEVQTSGLSFLERLGEIAPERALYAEIDIPWEKPPSTGS
jgi:hypothetical protein